MFGKKKKRLEISAPSNFEHRVHTGFDPREQKFTGLPQQWQSLLADTANRPKPMVDPSYITPIQLAPMKVQHECVEGIWPGRRGRVIAMSPSVAVIVCPASSPSPLTHVPPLSVSTRFSFLLCFLVPVFSLCSLSLCVGVGLFSPLLFPPVTLFH